MFDSKRFLHVTFSKTIEQHYNDTTTRETEHALKNCDDIFSLLSDQYTMPLNQSANDYISFLEIFWHDRFFTHAKKIMLELHTLLDDSEDVLLEVFNNIIRGISSFISLTTNRALACSLLSEEHDSHNDFQNLDYYLLGADSTSINPHEDPVLVQQHIQGSQHFILHKYQSVLGQSFYNISVNDTSRNDTIFSSKHGRFSTTEYGTSAFYDHVGKLYNSNGLWEFEYANSQYYDDIGVQDLVNTTLTSISPTISTLKTPKEFIVYYCTQLLKNHIAITNYNKSFEENVAINYDINETWFLYLVFKHHFNDVIDSTTDNIISNFMYDVIQDIPYYRGLLTTTIDGFYEQQVETMHLGEKHLLNDFTVFSNQLLSNKSGALATSHFHLFVTTITKLFMKQYNIVKSTEKGIIQIPFH